MTIKPTDELEFPAEMRPQFRLIAAIKITNISFKPLYFLTLNCAVLSFCVILFFNMYT